MVTKPDVSASPL